jgi:hypothetical protein
MLLHLLFALQAFASTPQYRISSELLSGSKIIARPRVVVNDGSLAEIRDGKDLAIKVTPTSKNGAVQLRYSIRYHADSTALEILAKPGQVNTFTLQGKHPLLVKVTADLVPPPAR